LLLGQPSLKNLQVAAVPIPAAVLAVFIGMRLVRVLPEALFFRLVGRCCQCRPSRSGTGWRSGLMSWRLRSGA